MHTNLQYNRAELCSCNKITILRTKVFLTKSVGARVDYPFVINYRIQILLENKNCRSTITFLVRLSRNFISQAKTYLEGHQRQSSYIQFLETVRDT